MLIENRREGHPCEPILQERPRKASAFFRSDSIAEVNVGVANKRAEASVFSEPGDIHNCLVLLANPPFRLPQKLKGGKLFIINEWDRLADSVKNEFQK